MPWLEPLPDALLGGDPAAVVTGRESIRLAVVAAMQFRPPRQPIPEELADELLDLAVLLIRPPDRAGRFAAAPLSRPFPAEHPPAGVPGPGRAEPSR